MKNRITNFFSNLMQGRYGMDELSRMESIAILVILVLTLIFSSTPFYLIGMILWLALMVHMYFRMFSRNISKRSAENQKYLDATSGIRRSMNKNKVHRQQRDVWRYFKCPQCHQEVRVPAKRGKICITCPKCRTEFVRKT
ncbi:MAG: hypothetical protein LIO37_01990 [Clostridiales bacterium]|nr:hypothetical protein [Clostridiales bacterium]